MAEGEYDLVEKPFYEQLKAMGWQWLEGNTTMLDLRSAEASTSLPHHNREFWQAIEGH